MHGLQEFNQTDEADDRAGHGVKVESLIVFQTVFNANITDNWACC